MANIEIISEFTILMKDHLQDTKNFNFSFTLSSYRTTAKVNLDFSKKLLMVQIDKFAISEELTTRFLNNFSVRLGDYSKEEQTEIRRISSISSDAGRKVLSYIKYHLHYFDISENMFSIKFKKWRFDNTDWNPVPMELHITFDAKSLPRFDERIEKSIQDALDQDCEPLLALRHLHRAKNESIAHYKWIDATIAAELAIKEALIRCKPELEVLLMEIPSPPLHKLYGVILEEYLGERSPYLNIIKKGVEIRNKLVHKPTYERVNDRDAIEYVNDIEKAIVHLMWLLYPKSAIISDRWRLINL